MSMRKRGEGDPTRQRCPDGGMGKFGRGGGEADGETAHHDDYGGAPGCLERKV